MPLEEGDDRFDAGIFRLMSLTLRSQISWLAVASVLAAGAVPLACPRAYASSVQTYVDEALPLPGIPNDSQTSEPIKPGDITMRDVLRTYAKQKQRSDGTQPGKVPESTAAAPPLLTHSGRTSTSGSMMMQGMRSVLRATNSQVQTSKGSGAAHSVASHVQLPGSGLQRGLADLLNDPLPGGARVPEQGSTTVPQTSVTIEGTRYQPGQEPKKLGQSAFVPSPALTEPYQQPASLGAGVQPTAAQQCTGRATSWVKSCVDAGYPPTFVGEIRGETRNGCSGGGLRDVWVSNSCSPPGEQVEREVVKAPPAENLRAAGNSVPQGVSETRILEPAGGVHKENTLTDLAGSAVAPANQMGDSELAVEVVAARCGLANGLATARKPMADLCNSGLATEVSGNGPWRWSCKGTRGGMTVSCAAPFAQDAQQAKAGGGGVPIVQQSGALSKQSASLWGAEVADRSSKILDGRCGSAADVGASNAPSANLCAQGIASHVSGSGPWSWACSGANGGAAAACLAPRIADGICGSANGSSSDRMPSVGLCNNGYASAVTGEGPWYWACSGLYGGEAATCSASRVVNAVCGQASLEGHRKVPLERLCSMGQPSSVAGSGPWSWTCSGTHGGSQVSCSASVIVDGACGSSNGGAFPAAPSENLCAKGTASSVLGDGPWAWSCVGTDGGESQSCTALRQKEDVLSQAAAIAPVQMPDAVPQKTATQDSDKEIVIASGVPIGLGLCGSAAELAALVAPDHDLCARGVAGKVSGDGPWSWTCADNNGLSESCATLSLSASPQASTDAAREASMPALASVPDSPANTSHETSPAVEESLSDVPVRKPKMPSGNGSVTEPSATGQIPSVSGAMGGDKPIALISKSGKSGQATLASPAIPVAQPVIKAACGGASGQGFSQAPSSNLCQDGSFPGALSGNGPWTWDCSNGSGKVACTALKFMNGACGAANGAMLDHVPRTDLCVQGAATEVFGAGPWLWTCVGAGGGGSSSCSTAAIQLVRVDGACGAAAKNMLQSAPQDNLCESGLASPVYGGGPWTWTCSGVNGGVAAPCSASQSTDAASEATAPQVPAAPVDGYCGSANGMAIPEQPAEEGLCASGQHTLVVGEGPWNWNCMGLNGGMSVSCTAPLLPPAALDGACGSASGVPALVMPSGGLCASGISSSVSGKGPWTWSCSGINGGSAVGCVAPFAGKSAGMSGSALPSLVSGGGEIQGTQSSSVPQDMQLGKARLVTPSLRDQNSYSRKPSVAPAAAGQASVGVPPALSLREKEGLTVPAVPPVRATEAAGLVPPSMRGNERKPVGNFVDGGAAIVPGNHFVLGDDVSLVAFSGSDGNLNGEAVKVLDKLALVLASNKGVRVTLTAYAGNKDISPRDARRLSLSRGLAVRDYLASKGIAAGRIDVRALGSNVPSGDPDRVDVRAN